HVVRSNDGWAGLVQTTWTIDAYPPKELKSAETSIPGSAAIAATVSRNKVSISSSQREEYGGGSPAHSSFAERRRRAAGSRCSSGILYSSMHRTALTRDTFHS